MYKLEFLTGELVGTSRTVLQDTILIGRDDDCDVVLNDPDVSRRHARIVVEDGQARVVDLGALNSCMVNGMQVKEALVEHGDVIKIAEVEMRYLRVKEAKPFATRSKSTFEIAAWSLLGLLVVAEVGFILLQAPRWRGTIDMVAINPTPTPTPLPRPTPEPTPIFQAKPTPKPKPTPVDRKSVV